MKCANGGFKWGDTGKCYPTRAQAERQGKAIQASKKASRKRKSRG